MHDYGSAIKVIHSGKYTDMYNILLEQFPLLPYFVLYL